MKKWRRKRRELKRKKMRKILSGKTTSASNCEFDIENHFSSLTHSTSLRSRFSTFKSFCARSFHRCVCSKQRQRARRCLAHAHLTKKNRKKRIKLVVLFVCVKNTYANIRSLTFQVTTNREKSILHWIDDIKFREFYEPSNRHRQQPNETKWIMNERKKKKPNARTKWLPAFLFRSPHCYGFTFCSAWKTCDEKVKTTRKGFFTL